jgi:hypothetical protein
MMDTTTRHASSRIAADEPAAPDPRSESCRYIVLPLSPPPSLPFMIPSSSTSPTSVDSVSIRSCGGESDRAPLDDARPVLSLDEVRLQKQLALGFFDDQAELLVVVHCVATSAKEMRRESRQRRERENNGQNRV